MAKRPAILASSAPWELATRVVDVAALALAFALIVYTTADGWTADLRAAGATVLVAYLLVAEFAGLYRAGRGQGLWRECVQVASVWGASVLAVLVWQFLVGENSVARSLMRTAAFVAPAILLPGRCGLRWLFSWLRSRGWNARTCAIVGVTDLGMQLAQNIDGSPELGLRLLGFFDDRPDERLPELPADVGRRLGRLDELYELARSGRVDCVYLTFPLRAEQRMREVLQALSDSTASVYLVPDLFVFQLLHSRWTSIKGLPAVSVFEHPFFGVDGLLKRACDLVLASVALVALAVPMACIALLVKLTSPGPVFFRQRRYGLGGKEIRVWKFRSMRVCEDGKQVTQAVQGDSRVTPLGAFLRRSSLDELPQLFNVLDGSMSLVGPRPHASAHNEQYRKLIDGYMLRHKVKPGITGLAQINGWRGETDTAEKMHKRVECDHQYIRNWSLGLDLFILWKTVWVVLKRQNAY